MPKFDLAKNLNNLKNKNYNILKSSNLQILLDGKDYIEKGEYRKVNKIEYKSKNGHITIEGLFDFSNKDILNLIKFDYLTILFSNELKQSFKLQFDSPKISIFFNLTKDSINLVKNNINKLKTKYTNFDTDYKTYIKFTLSNFTDINILSFLQSIENDENIDNDYNDVDDSEIMQNEKSSVKEKKVKKKKFNINNLINNNGGVENEDEENEIKIIKEGDDEGEEGLINPFLQHFEKKEEKSEQDEKIERYEKSINFLKKDNYIKVNDFDKFDFPPIISIKNSIINKYISDNIQQKLKDKIANNYFMTININNTYTKFNQDENKTQSLEIKTIPFNEELKDLKQNYINDTLVNFITILFNNDNFNNKEKSMSINDYTYIIISLIKNIDNIIIDIKQNNNINNENNKKYFNYIQRLEKVISSLKLFHILFLNCFITNENNNNIIDYENLYDNHISLKVQTMRKKMLIEWCMNEEKNYIKKNDLININKTLLDKNKISKQIICFGQIKTAIKVNNSNKNLFLNAKLSNLMKEKNKENETFTYYIKKQNEKNNIDKSFISYENLKDNDKIKNNWVSFFLQSLLYIENTNEYIIKSIKLIEEKIDDMDDISKPIIKGKDKENDFLQLNYLLLKIYEYLMENNSNSSEELNESKKDEKDEKEEKKEKKIKKDIIYYINMFSNNSLFSTNDSDHFIQYILLFLLTKVININFENININNNILNKKLYILFSTIISEILSINSKNTNANQKEKNDITNLILIIKLLHCLNITNKSKQKIFIDIITRTNFQKTENFWEIYEKNEENENISFITDEIKEYINGIFYMNKCKWYEAYKCFLKSKKYDYCINAYINYCFCLINEKNIEEIDFEEIINNLNEIQKIDSSLFADFYDDFYQIISFIVSKHNWDYEEIINYLNKYIKEYDGKDKIFYLNDKNHRMIIKLLYQVLLSKNEEDDKLILNGEESYIKLNNILFEDKKGMLHDILRDIIEHKNIQFSLKEI